MPINSSRDKRFPEEAYTLTHAERDGLPAVAMINLAYQNYEFCSEFPWLIEVEITIACALEPQTAWMGRVVAPCAQAILTTTAWCARPIW